MPHGKGTVEEGHVQMPHGNDAVEEGHVQMPHGKGTVEGDMISSIKVLATLAWLKQIDLAGHWLVQHTAPVRVKPDSRPRLEGVRYKYLTSCSTPTNPSHATSPPLPGLAHWTVKRSQR